MGVGDGAHEGGKEFLAIAAHRTSGHTQSYMSKEEPHHDSPEANGSEQACEDHQKYASSVLAHRPPPFVSLGCTPTILSAAGRRRAPPCQAYVLQASHTFAGTLVRLDGPPDPRCAACHVHERHRDEAPQGVGTTR